MKDRLIKIEGENRITFNGVVETVARMLCEEDKQTVFKWVMAALKANGVICEICDRIIDLKEMGQL